LTVKHTLPFKNRPAWREWLEQHHDTDSEIWLMFYKRYTGIPSVTYDEAVEEAICFGWIDGIVQRVDEERHIQKFTPRKETSTWSKTNITRAERMIAEDLMTEAGLRKYRDRSAIPSRREQLGGAEFTFRPALLATLQSASAAWENYNRLPPSLSKQYTGWVMSARREETQERRLKELIEVLSKGERLGLK